MTHIEVVRCLVIKCCRGSPVFVERLKTALRVGARHRVIDQDGETWGLRERAIAYRIDSGWGITGLSDKNAVSWNETSVETVSCEGDPVRPIRAGSEDRLPSGPGSAIAFANLRG
jgi:hypothetical protein